MKKIVLDKKAHFDTIKWNVPDVNILHVSSEPAKQKHTAALNTT
jgi:hypothetical protein